MNTMAFISEWKSLASDPSLRLRAVRDYAHMVFGGAAIANAWLAQFHRSIRGGIVPVSAACQTTTGFVEAITELTRIEQARRQEALIRAGLAEADQELRSIQADSASSAAALTAASVPPLRTGT